MEVSIKGYWNGESATIKGVVYEVTEPERPTWWQAMHVGKQRQGLQISYSGSVWIIDNEHGDGFFKVTQGMGSPRCGHKSIDNPTLLHYISVDQINKTIDVEAIRLESEAYDKWMSENHPESFAKSQALRELINWHKNKN